MRFYEEPNVAILIFSNEIVRTSTQKDPFDDDYQDPNLGNGNFGS